MGHYIIIGIVVVLIIGVQIYFFSKTLKEIRIFSNIFPKSTDKLYAHDSEIYIGNKKSDNEQIDKKDTDEVVINDEDAKDKDDLEEDEVEDYEECDSVFKRIITSLNTYLRKNKGAASDYHLMKDIVERNCDAKENEIDTQIPTPLYTGLMGTVLGIIVGVVFLVSSGGLSALLDSDYDLVKGTSVPTEIIGRISAQDVVDKNKRVIVEKNEEINFIKAEKIVAYAKENGEEIKLVSDDSGSKGISALLSGIALAMIASFVGILFTTIP